MRNLTTSLLFVVIIATVGLGWVFDRLYEQYNSTEQIQDANAVAIVEKLGLNLANSLNNMAENHRQQFVQQWQDEIYSLSLVDSQSLTLPLPLLNRVKQGTPLLLETSQHLTFHYYISSNEQLLLLKSPLLMLSPETKSANYFFTLLFYCALVSMILLWVYPLIKQLIALRSAAKSFGEGKLQQRITLSSLSYIRDIEIEFNQMAQRIEDLIGDVKLLSSAVSHDLRTPLARIRFGIDTLLEEDDPKLRRQFEQKISDNVDEMTSLVETLLSYARLDQTMLEMNKAHCDFLVLVENCIRAKVSDNMNITLMAPKNDYCVYADSTYLNILVNNLIENALNYGENQVNIQLKIQSHTVEMIVEDDGEGVNSKIKMDILKPFVRGNHQQNGVKGHGIGLAIVKRVIDWHKGSIDIGDSESLGGAKFTVTLPKE